MNIWIDADACPKPVKEIVYKAAERNKVKTILVANSMMHFPSSDFISLEIVEHDFNGADNYIIEKSIPGDLVITSDIPLAVSLVKKEILVLSPKGEVFTAENIGEVSATRELLSQLRGAGQHKGGPCTYSLNDKQAFANTFNAQLTGLLK